MTQIETIDEDERYDRQNYIPGWDQSKLKNAKVVIIGSSILTEFICVGLAAMGIGNIRIIGNKENSMDGLSRKLNLERNVKENVKNLQNFLQKINSDVKVTSIFLKITPSSTIFIRHPNLIIDTSDDRKIKKTVFDFCKKRGLPLISVGIDEKRGMINIIVSYEKEEEIFDIDKRAVKDTIIIEIIGGLVSDEVRRILMPLKKEKIENKKIVYPNG